MKKEIFTNCGGISIDEIEPRGIPKEIEENGEEKEIDNSFKTRFNLAEMYNISKDDVRNIFYKFGSNELNIGIGLISVLCFLEKRYGINFNELENQYNNKQKVSSTKTTK